MAEETLEIQIKTLAEVSSIKDATKEFVKLKTASNEAQKEILTTMNNISKSFSDLSSANLKETATELIKLKKISNETHKESVRAQKESGEAQKEILKTTKAFSGAQGQILGHFSKIREEITAIPGKLSAFALGFFTVTKAVSVFRDAIHEAQIGEEVFNRLKGSLRGSEQDVLNQASSFKELASEMQRTTKFSDNLVLSQVTLAKNFGLSNDETDRLIRAAAQLSTVWGKDLQTSTEALLKTLAGQLPRELSVLGKEFRNLSIEQLKAGSVLDIINTKFGGRAQEDIKTYNGSIEQLKNNYSSLLQTLGEFVTKSSLVSSSVNLLSSAIASINSSFENKSAGQLTKELKEAQEESLKLAISFRDGSATATDYFKIVGLGIKSYFSEPITEASIQAKQMNESLQDITFNIDQAKKAARDKESFLGLDRSSIDKFIRDIEKVGQSVTDLAKKEKEERLKELNEVFGGERTIDLLSLNDKKIYSDAKLRIEKDYNKKVQEERDKNAKKEEQSAKDALQTFSEAKNNIAKGFVEFFKSKDTNALSGALSGLGTAITQGAGGARSLLGQGALFAGGALGGPVGEQIGAAVGPIIQELSKGKEAARAFVTEFLNSIPDMIVGLVEGIVAAADVLAQKMPEVVDRLVQNAPRIISALVEGAPKIAAEFQAQMPAVAATFASSLISQAPAIAQAIVKSIANTPGNIGKGVGKVFKFAEGGQGFVKSVPAGFGSGSTERFPAVLGSGELVVDRSTATKLKSFLDYQSNISTTSNDGPDDKMSLIMAALNRPVIVNIDGREVARATRSQVRSGFVLA